MITAIRTREELRLGRPSRRTARRAAALVTVVLLAAGCSSKAPSATPAGNSNKLVQNGLAAESTGQSSQAAKDFQAAVAEDSKNKYGYYDLGVIYQQQNDIANASIAYRRALLIDPNYKPALFNLAVLETPGDPAGAISLYQQLLVINPNDANVNFNLGLLLVGQGQAAAGKADLQKAVAEAPSLASRLPANIKL